MLITTIRGCSLIAGFVLSANINSNISGINRIVRSLERHEPVEMNEVNRRVKNLQQECRKGFSPENENLRHRAIKALQDLGNNLPTKVEMVRKTILSIEKAPVIEGPLKLAIFLDIDGPDHNNAITMTQMTALDGGIPFITSRAILTGSEYIAGGLSRGYGKLAECKEKWEIYAHGEFLVFLPKTLLSGASEKEKLKALDLAYDGTLRRITPMEALRGSGGKRDYQKLTEIFSPTPTRNKVIYIDGHGGLQTVAALEKETLLKFLGFLKEQKCVALTISSCFSGGTSTEFYLPPEESLESLPYPVIVRSIGDFPSRSNQDAEDDLKFYLDEVASFFQQPVPPTVAHFRRMLIKAEQSKEKVPQNLVQIYFPHDPRSPGGFRPVGEGGKSLSLTYVELKKSPKGISVRQKKFLELHPLVVKAPLIFEDKAPVLLSMIPGSSHHLISSIDSKFEAPYEFLKRTAAFHKEAQLAVKKGFFIGKIKFEKLAVRDVVLFLGPSGNFCLYREGDDYFFMNLDKEQAPEKITKFQYGFMSDRVERETRPSPKMVRAATGGQQDEKEFHKAYQKRGFSIEPPAIHSMSVPEKESYVFHLMAAGNSGQAFDVFTSENLSPDMRSLFGLPLLYEVIKAGDQKFLDMLLQKGVNVNDGFSLTLAIEKGDQATFDKLLKNPNLDVNQTSAEGFPAIFAAVEAGGGMFEALIARGADVDKLDVRGYTILGRKAYLNQADKVDLLLSAKADPNKDTPSALYMAIIGGDINIIQKLLSAGGSAFKADTSRRIPFFRALKTATPEVVELLLKQPDCDLTLKDGSSDNTAVMVALESGSIEKVGLLLEKGAAFPEVVGRLDAMNMMEIIQKYCKIGNWEGVEQLLKWNNSKINQFHDIVAEAAAEESPEKLTDFIRNGLIEPVRIFNAITKLAIENFEPYKEALELAVNAGADPMAEVRYTIPFRDALSNKKTEILKIFLPKITGALDSRAIDKIIELGDLSLIQLLEGKGVDLYTAPLFNTAVQSNNVEVVKYFIGKVDVNPKNESGDYLPMEFAANNNNLEMLKLLAAHGGDLNRHGKSSRATPFAILASKRDLNTLNWALDQGAEVNPVDPQGETPLEAAQGNGVIVKRLLQAGAEWTEKAAARVVEKGDLQLVKYCLKAGANIGTQEAYFAAIRSGNLAVLALVQREGGDTTVPENALEGLLLEVYNQGHREMFLELLEMGMIAVTMKEKLALWDRIIAGSDMKSFRALLKVEEDLSIPYNAAIEYGNLPMILELEQHGYPKNYEFPEDVYVSLIDKEHIEVLEHLFELGLEMDKNFFQYAVSEHRTKVVKLLLDLGADPDQAIDTALQTAPALLVAVARNDPELVKMLVEAGATVDRKVMDMAYKMDNKEIVQMLED